MSPSLYLEATTEDRPLLETAALAGFWNLPVGTLRRLGRSLGATYDESTLAAVLLQTCKAAMGRALTALEQLRVLEARVPRVSEAMAFLETEEAQGLLEEDEKKAVKEQEKARRSKEDGFAEVVKMIKTLREQLQKQQAKKGMGSGPSSSSGALAAAKKKRKYPPIKDLADAKDVDVEFLDTFLPAGCRFGKDELDGGWRLNCYGVRFYRSWNLHGVEGGARQLVALAWQKALEEGREEKNPYEEGLLA